MLKLVIFTLFVSACARPQDLDTNRVLPLSQELFNVSDIKFEQIEAKPAPEIVNNDASYGYAVDFSLPTSLSQMKCLKSANYAAIFVRAFTPSGSGAFDTNSVATIRNAYSAGLGIEVYMTPQPISSLQGYQQFDLLYNGLVNNGITVRSIWIQVTSPVNWSKTVTTNINFINSIISRAQQHGLSVGIYTSQYDWNQITGNWVTAGSNLMLWYWNVYGPGVTGETPATFADFRAFGSFKQPSVKQYAQVESLCNLVVNRDVYAVGIPAAAAAATKTDLTNSKNIVVGGVIRQ